MPDGADVVLEIVGALQYADGARVALALHGARSIEVLAHGPGVEYFMASLEQGAAIELEAAL
jgi:intracellular sulfur oxidation DsrE/DsrF family protein